MAISTAIRSILTPSDTATADASRGTPSDIDETGPKDTVQNIETAEHVDENGVTVREINITGRVSGELGIRNQFIAAVERKWNGVWTDIKSGVKYVLNVDLEKALLNGDIHMSGGSCVKNYACAEVGGRRITVVQATKFAGDPTGMAHEFGHLLGFKHAPNGSGNVMSYDNVGKVSIKHAQQLWEKHNAK